MQKRGLFFSQENQGIAVTGVNYFTKDPGGFCFLFVFLLHRQVIFTVVTS